MKIVLNECYGGFSVSEKWATDHGYASSWNVNRMDPELIAAVEAREEVNSPYSRLIVVEIPEEATDWKINEYDGMESIIAVINGKIVYI